MTERENLLNRVRMYDFALIDAGLFLDGHPKNAAALSYHEKTRKKYDEAVAAYEAKYGPLAMKRESDTMMWHWIDDPWPWEGADN